MPAGDSYLKEELMWATETVQACLLSFPLFALLLLLGTLDLLLPLSLLLAPVFNLSSLQVGANVEGGPV